MSGKQFGGFACLALAAIAATAGAVSLTKGDGPAADDPSGLGVSRAIGAFLVPLLLLIAGLWLFQKPKPGRPA